MGLLELTALVAENLGRRKGRVALTAIGVIIGTAAVVILVSLAVGLQMDATERLGGIGDLTLVQVYPNYGDMGGGPVVMGPGIPGGGQPSNQKLITNESLIELSGLPGVAAVMPRDYLQMGGMLTYGSLESYAGIIGIGTTNLADLGLAAAQGTLELERGTVVIGSFIPLNFYNPRLRPGQEPPPPPELLDQTLALTLIKWDPNTEQEVRKTIQVKVVGIIAESRGEADYNMYMSIDEVSAMNEWGMGRRINRARDGYPQATVRINDVRDALNVTEQITTLGYQAQTPQSFIEGINSFFVVLQVIFGGVGTIALLVAAIGIANTMTMAILERTREIGLMKAIGATNRDVLSVFLGEAAGIGLIGGLGGVGLGWSLGQVINVLALSYLAGQAAQTGGPPPTVAVYTPLWLPIFALVFATLMGLLSGLYPALRAATLVPVNALKYE